MRALYLIPIVLTNISAIDSGAKEVYSREGDLNVALILRNDCNNTATLTTKEQSVVNSAIWTTHQLNFSEILQFTLGLSVYKTCNEREEYDTIFEIFQKKNEQVAGLVTTDKFPLQMQKLCDALELNVKPTLKCTLPLIRASVALLKTLNWVENVTVVADDQTVLREFLKLTRHEWMCVTQYLLHDNINVPRNLSSDHLVIFGDHHTIKNLLKSSDFTNAIVVPSDDSTLNGLPENSYIINGQDFDHEEDFYTPDTELFEIATPLVNYAQTLSNCNLSNYKECLKNRPAFLELNDVADLLKIETSSINYYIYKSDNASAITKAFIYNIFSGNLTQLASVEVANKSKVCTSQSGCQDRCKNFEILGDISFNPEECQIRIRTESWVFAFLSLSLLGVLLCIAILIFLLVAICRRNVLEGNPVLTILLLLTVMLMYCSVLPFALDSGKFSKNTICIARALSITLSFSAAFSLILSRNILLATAWKEIGFMSHVAGPVQAFLCLFIFGVQAALSLQVISRCGDIFKGFSFIYLLSYNVMLLLLLLCLSPLIIKCQRNYKEGKYFTFSSITISFLWCVWIPAYAFLHRDYKDSVLCFGLVSTASALLGTIFIPRTYLMTIAAAREKMTSTLPSTSAMDIYRAGSQPVYDCVNVAAINAVTVARAGLTQLQGPDLYTCPNLPEDDFDLRCESPVNDDKVTRF